MRVLTFTTLFPNVANPNHGIFVENRLRHLLRTGAVESTVLAPVAWLPGRHRPVPSEETRGGLRVLHPRWTPIPAIGMSVSPWILYAYAERALSRLVRNGCTFDLIDAHYFYPDGIAAVWLGRRFGLPVVVTARGSDVTQFPHYAVPRRLIRDAARQSGAVITVSAGLRDALIGLGVAPDKITVLRNGVDLDVFKPMNRMECRRAFDAEGRLLVSVGSLIERKGHHRTIAALAHLPDWHLLIAGEGPERSRLTSLAHSLGVASRVTLLGSLPHARLPVLYNAADLSMLSSSREGWANVLLESMACGTPVIASPITGNPEVVQSPAAGRIAEENSPAGLAKAVRDWEATQPDRRLTRSYAERFGWEETSAGQLKVFETVLAVHGTPGFNRGPFGKDYYGRHDLI